MTRAGFIGVCACLFGLPHGVAENQTEARVVVAGHEEKLVISHGAQDLSTDTDGDGLADGREVELGSDPAQMDSDGDGYLDLWEANYGLDPTVANSEVRVKYVPTFLALPEGFEGAEISVLADDWAAGYGWAGSRTAAIRWNLVTGAMEVSAVGNSTFPYAINNHGVAVGTYENFEGMVWGPGMQPMRLGAVPNHIFYARDVNAQNLVVGRSNTVIGGTGAYAWQFPGDPTANFIHLPAPTGYSFPFAVAINDRSQIAGAALHVASGERHAVIWENGVGEPIAELTGFFELEQITKDSKLLGRRQNDAFVWSRGKGLVWLPRGNLGESAVPWKMNAAGEIVGDIWGTSVIWRPRADGTWHVAPIGDEIDDPDVAFGRFYSINDRGEIGGAFDSLVATYPVILRPVVLPEIAVDANRDGTIDLINTGTSDLTSAEQPFRFWVNDDDDFGDVRRARGDDIPRPIDDGARDSANDLVDGVRDLDDFFPAFLNLRQMLTILPAGVNGVTYHLRHAGAALGVVFTTLSRSEAFAYLRAAPAKLAAAFGPALDEDLGVATVVNVSNEGIDLGRTAPAFLQRLSQGEGGVILLEAKQPTIEPLVLEVRQDDQLLVEITLPLKIDPVESMFSYQNLRSFASGSTMAEDDRGPNFGIEDVQPAPNDLFPEIENRRNFVFLHGFNVNPHDARGWATSVFKRLYWSGSRARFYAVVWRGDDGQGEGLASDGTTSDYHRNVGHAWQQGIHFRDFIERLEGPTAIMAHSLGSIVALTALTHARDPGAADRIIRMPRPASVTDFFAVAAAVPIEAVAAAGITDESKSNMRNSAWKNYEERLWASSWYRLFDDDDARSRLTWKDVFAQINIGTNFFSGGEEVLANPASDAMPILEPIFERGLHAWVAQEKCKGGRGLAASGFRSVTAGWGLNPAWFEESAGMLLPLSGTQATESRLPATALVEEPFFKRFQANETDNFYPGYEGDRLMAPLHDPTAHAEAQKIVTVAKCLGEAIPALSYALGANASERFDSVGLGGNFNLNAEGVNPTEQIQFKNGWPASRKDRNWKHSDCVDVAYVFVRRLFDQIVSQHTL